MKKLLLPGALMVVGVILFGFSFIQPKISPSDLDVDIERASFIMPAVHRVYANPEALDGKYYLFKAKITNRGNRMLEDVAVKYRIPGYVEWQELGVSGQLFPGQTLAVPCYPKFADTITEKTTESMEKVEIEIAWDGADQDDIIEESFTFKFTNRNEYVYTGIPREEISGWSDVYDNDALIACFVTPNDPIIRYYTQNLQEKILKGEAASVTNKLEDGVRFLKGIYEATLRSHMVYSGTKGIPQSTDDVESMVQQVRLPREVVTGNTGLCIELSCLYASVLSSAGINPVIFFVPGHAYPGFHMNGQYFAIEATSINGEGLGGIASADEAFETGMKQLKEFMQQAQAGDPRYTIVDIHQLNQQGVTSMALKDNQFLREKVDKIVASWIPVEKPDPAPQPQPPQQQPPAQWAETPPNPAPGPAPITPSPTTQSLSFAVPMGWQTIHRPNPQMPIMTAQAVAPDQMATASVFDIPVNTIPEALNSINYYFSMFGMSLEYQYDGNELMGRTYSATGTFNWVGKAIPTQNGIRVVAVGAPDYYYPQAQGVINQVFQSIR